MFRMMCLVLLAVVVSCAGPVPLTPPEGCTECGSGEAPLPSSGCYPYCEGEESPPAPPGQVTPDGRYLGTWSLTSVDGPNTAACLERTPIGFQLAHRIKVVSGATVTERDQACTTTSTSPGDFGFWCLNYNFWAVCSTDPTSPNYYPTNPDCRQWWERVEEQLQFSVDAKSANGAAVTTRNWGDCTTYRWTARYDWIVYP